MMRCVFAALAGALFGLGLVVSELANPLKVLAFLDVTGRWDPSLLGVILSAIVVTAIGYAVLRRRDAPWFDTRFHWPTLTRLDPRLIGGAALFGVGWGIAGYCPGPALTALVIQPVDAVPFVAAMLAGLWLARRV